MQVDDAASRRFVYEGPIKKCQDTRRQSVQVKQCISRVKNALMSAVCIKGSCLFTERAVLLALRRSGIGKVEVVKRMGTEKRN